MAEIFNSYSDIDAANASAELNCSQINLKIMKRLTVPTGSFQCPFTLFIIHYF